MRKFSNFIKHLLSLACLGFVVYYLILTLQGKDAKEEILSWFDNTVTLESVMEDNNMTREEAFRHIIDTTDSEDLPGILADMRDHVFLNGRGVGISSNLTDDVRVIVIFTSIPSAPWTSEEMEAAQADFETMTNQIMDEAASYGANLNLSLEFHTSSINQKEVTQDNAANFANVALAFAGLPSLETASRDLEREYNVKQAPIIFCLNYHDRSHAHSQYSNGQYSIGQSEYAFVFRSTNGFTSFPHELYHIFGAQDFYFPADVKALAEDCFANSAMLISEGTHADDLTAYLISWTDTPSDTALSFLQDTAHLTPEYMSQQHDLETFTGAVEDYDTGDGTYTGNLDYGIPQGYGVKVWNDGERYEGEWDYGSFHGEGTYTWTDGTVYSGSWDQGTQNGYGTTTWADGRTYTGYYVDGYFHGEGTHIWANGNSYAGEWVEGKCHGYGTYTWVDSGIYTGEFIDGRLEGEGTYTWNNGDSFTGEWVDGQRTGYGTYTWADGSTLSGYWEDGEFIE